MSRRFLCMHTPNPVCHGYAVGLSADISTASVFPTVFVFVRLLYHILPAKDEESMNGMERIYIYYIQKRRCKKQRRCELCGVHVGQEQQNRDRQREQADEPGVQGFPGEAHQRKTTTSEE